MKTSPLLVFLFLLQISCNKSDNEARRNLPLSGAAIWQTAGVAGQVIGENNLPLQGASVTFGTKSVSTDANGYFQFNQSSFNTKEAFVTVKKSGFFNGTRTFLPRSGSNNYMRIQLLESKIVGTINGSSGGRVVLPTGVVINIPPTAIADGNSAYSGKVTVFASYIDPTDIQVNEKMPGDLRGISKTSQERLLKTFGMVAVELRSAADKLLNIKVGSQATLEFPIPQDLLSSAPFEIPLWFFNESTGLWKEEGRATKSGTSFIGTVKHFSFWNVDEPKDFVKLSLKLISLADKPVSGAKVKITDSDGASFYDYTDNLGYLDGYVPKQVPLIMEVFDNCGTIVFTQNIESQSTDKDLGIITLNSGTIPLLTVSGKVLNCSGGVLKNGTVQIILDANHVEFTSIVDGNFSATFLSCNEAHSVQLIAIDESSLQRSEIIPVELTGTETKVQDIAACGVDLPEYVNIYIDGVEQFANSPIQAGGVESTISYSDASFPLEIFKGDTLLGGYKRNGLMIGIKVYDPVHLPDSATLVNIMVEDPKRTTTEELISYSPTDVNVYNRLVKLSSFGDYGKIIEGNYSGKFLKMKGCCPNSETLDTVTISGSFRIKNIDPPWPY